MTPWDGVLVAGAGFVAGALNAVAGGGTLVTFPALMAAGLTARMANIVSTAGLVYGYAGGSVAYRKELAGQGRRVRSLALTSFVGGVTGAAILLATPTDSFRSIVPYLILCSCALLAARPRLSSWVARRDARADRTAITPTVHVGVLVSAVYGSYFGAGLGVLLLAVLGILLSDGIQRLNALKGLLSLVINAVGVLVFVIAGDIASHYAFVLAVSAWLGATAGVGVARLLPPAFLQGAVIALGVSVAVVLLVKG